MEIKMKYVHYTECKPTWITSDSKAWFSYNSARYHEIVLKIRKLIKNSK